MMLGEKIRRALPPRRDSGRMVGCGDSPNPNPALGQLLTLPGLLFLLLVAGCAPRRLP